MLKADEFAEVRPGDVNEIVAPVTDAGLKAVSPAKVAVPATAALAVVPPIVQVPAPTAAVMLAELAVTLPNWSCTTNTGCVPSKPPSAAGAVGCVVMTSFAAVPPTSVCTTELVL